MSGRSEVVGYVVLEHHEKYDAPKVYPQYAGVAPHVMDAETAEAWCGDCNEAEAEDPRGYSYTVASVSPHGVLSTEAP